jgi:uncharacterized protein (TIGR00290 family)
MHKAVISWSGGKDSCFATYKGGQLNTAPVVLLNVMNEDGVRSRSHGIPPPILEAQAAALGLPLHLISASWQEYEVKFTNALKQLQHDYQISHALFGDIDLQAHKDWEEKVCTEAGLTAVLPLWKRNRKEVVMEMLDWGLETIIISCQSSMGPHFLGKTLSPDLVIELENQGIDPCGENGEFHTLVLNCPLFHSPIKIQAGEALLHQEYWFMNLQLAP